MNNILKVAAAGTLLSVVGCGGRQSASPVDRPEITSLQQVMTPDRLSLAEITPVPVLAGTAATAPAPTTQPAPLQAIELYARGRDALQLGNRLTAVDLLEQAAEVDPDSFSIKVDLADAYLGSKLPREEEKALAALLDAQRLKADDLSLQLALGRLYASQDNLDAAITHLRLARQTQEYGRIDVESALVDLFLGRALEHKGYTTAALEAYESLWDRLSSPSIALRMNRELALLSFQPQVLAQEMGRLYEKLGRFDDAVAIYDAGLSRQDGEAFGLEAAAVRALAQRGEVDEAARRAASLVVSRGADAPSLDLIADLHEAAEDKEVVIGAMRARHRSDPGNRAAVFGLSELLRRSGRNDQAMSLLQEAFTRDPGDLEVGRRTVAGYLQQNQTTEAARVLIEALAASPDNLRELWPLWDDLIRPSQPNRLRLKDLQNLSVSPRAEAAKWYLVSRLAVVWDRDSVSRSSLSKAVKIDPPLEPAYREMVAVYWRRSDWDTQQKIDETSALAEHALSAGRPALAAEVRGLSLLFQEKPADALAEFDRALELGADSPELAVYRASVLRRLGRLDAYESALWDVVRNKPTFAGAYRELFSYFIQRRMGDQAVSVLRAWNEADPSNVEARLQQVGVLVSARQLGVAETLIDRLLNEHTDTPEVLSMAHAVYSMQGKLPDLIARLELVRLSQPGNRPVSEALISIYSQSDQRTEAMAVLDDLREAVKTDADMLYYVSHLYKMLDQRQTSLEVLEQVLAIDPRHAPANNDLGYEWADEGINLDRAERMIRIAVDAEPEDQNFLDSLGWVLYKRGKFDEALIWLEKAIADSSRPSPVVLDHLGDALYRLGRQQEAVARWKHAFERLGSSASAAERQEYRSLRLVLQSKLRQVDRGEPVTLAPTVEEQREKAAASTP